MPSTLIAEVSRIEEVVPHPDPSTTGLDLARVRNWWCGIKRGAFRAGDTCVFIPPDTTAPVPVADAWGITKYTRPVAGDAGRRRIVSCRLRGTPSRGLIIPAENPAWPLGFSVVEHYRLEKYEPPAQQCEGDTAPDIRGFHEYTGIEHYGNFPGVLVDGEEVAVEEKIHGKNVRLGLIMHEGEWTHVAGSHRRRRTSPSEYWLPMTSNMRELLAHASGGRHNVIVFGELFGRGVQDMGYGRDKPDFRAFDVAVDGEYMDWRDRNSLLWKFGVEVAPPLYSGPFSDAVLRGLVDGPTALCDAKDAGKFAGREGVVVRPLRERTHPTLGRAILKLISVDYENRH